MRMKVATLGIDLGGTKVSLALVDKNGKVFGFVKEPTEKSSPKALAEQIASLTEKLCHTSGKIKLLGIGLASAGPLNLETGELLYPSNFKGWKRVPLVKLLASALAKKKIRAPISFQNDAMAAALGEGWIGGAKGLETFVVVTLGTGIGTGVIFRGSPLQARGMGGEFGIQLVNLAQLKKVNDPYPACVEGLASGTGIFRRARAEGFAGSSIEDLHKDFLAGKLEHKHLFHEAATALAMLSYNLSLGLHPEKILFTGGLMHMREYFFEDMLVRYRSLISAHPGFRTKIGIAKLGYRAGVVGAARLPVLRKKN
jgi:glucokinase